MIKNLSYIVPVFLGLLSLSTIAAAQSGYHTVTHIKIQRIQDQECRKAPVTFGQPFVKGDVPKGAQLYARLDGRRLPTQVNVKATNRDGSARHAVITVLAPCSVGPSGASVALVTGARSPIASKPPVSLGDVLRTSYDTRISLKLGGRRWHLDARRLLQRVKRAGGCQDAEVFFCRRWLKGPLASEWVVGAPLKAPNGTKHPHLAAYFAVRAFGPAPVVRIRTDVAVENTWAYVKNPRNYHYQPTITVSDRSKPAYQPKAFTHYRQARWHHQVWWGKSRDKPLYAELDSTYLQSTPAVPRYAMGKLSPSLLHQRQSCPPMHHCGQTADMDQTGSQAAIGPLPRWSAAFVINPDYRIYRWMLANTDALGSYNFHYRQKDTGFPLTVWNHPCATRVWAARQKTCKVPPHGDDRFPKCHKKCKSPLQPDISHHPAPAYVAYLATGDWYYASEMAFIASWVTFYQNPNYRKYRKALVHHSSVRGQAWSLRTLADAAYLLPDNHPLKKYFNKVVANNIQWYTKEYVNNPNANKLGIVRGRFPYPNDGVPRTGTAVWQQSFFTWSIGNMVDMRFKGAKALLNWFSRFQISLMTSPDYCWPLASTYQLRVLKTSLGEAYDTIGKVYRKSFPKIIIEAGCNPEELKKAIKKSIRKNYHYPPNTMIGYPTGATGFPANFQIGLAAAYNSDLPNAHKAWSIFASRPVQPDYSTAPQFAVVPTLHR